MESKCRRSKFRTLFHRLLPFLFFSFLIFSGYAAEWDFERWYRQAPLNAIWEGSSNVQALDVLRTCSKEPQALRVFFSQLRSTRGVNLALDNFTDCVETLAQTVVSNADTTVSALFARHLLEQLALALQGHAMALGVKGGQSDGLRNVFSLWCSLRLPAASGSADGMRGLNLPTNSVSSFCFGAASPSQLRIAAWYAGLAGGTSSGREVEILDAILSREMEAITKNSSLYV